MFFILYIIISLSNVRIKIFIASNWRSIIYLFLFKRIYDKKSSEFWWKLKRYFLWTHYRRIQNVMKYIKVIPRNSCKGFPYRSRNFISANDSREDVSGMKVSRDDWKAGNARTGQSFLCPASSANDLHPRSCMNQGGSYGRIASCYEYLRASPAPISLVRNFSTRICQETNATVSNLNFDVELLVTAMHDPA